MEPDETRPALPEFVDVYVAAPSREARWVEQLLARVFGATIDTAPSTTGDTTLGTETIANPREFVDRAVSEPSLAGSWYWSGVHIHFTEDGGLILGWSLDQLHDEGKAVLDELKHLVGATDGYVAFDTPPDLPMSEFIRTARAWAWVPSTSELKTAGVPWWRRRVRPALAPS